MKKLLFMMFLMMGTLSFANSGVDPIKVKKTESAVWCCTVGAFRFCSYQTSDPCGEARRWHCASAGNCTQATINSIYPPGTGGSCALACGCGQEGDGGSSGGTIIDAKGETTISTF